MIPNNAITRAFLNPNVGEHYGQDKAHMLMDWAHSKAPLDASKDPPMPQWIYDVINLGKLSYRMRLAIIKSHNADIIKEQGL